MNGICAIVVTFNPPPDVAANVAALLPQVDALVIVDNASRPAAKVLLEPLRAEAKVNFIFNAENLGIGAALNQGVRFAQERGFEWIASFDQDSRAPADYLRTLLDARAAFPQPERVAVVAPRYRDNAAGTLHSFAYGRPPEHELFAVVRTTITSGNLLPAKLFAAAGFFREDFFIDYVDHEFCLRCRRAGWVILEARRAMLDHRLGAPTRHKFLWMRPQVFNRSPARHYYIARNRLMTYRLHGGLDWAWMLRDAKEFLRETAKLILLEADKGPKLRALGQGIWHAVTGRLGPRPV
ncbi:MAG: glycosyltransferase family 2 protein [Verrucomicrobia bacterium]|nr:glycosyltransferase family 2 protein [Verrucomicrobiota bacterium]